MGELKGTSKIEINKLIPYVNNAKIHSESQIARIASSIREFGFLNPVLIDKDNNIIAGHGRVLAAQKIGLESVPFVYAEGLTDAQRKAYILADNRLAEFSDWDMSIVNSELEILQEFDFDISLTGFDAPQIEEETEIVEDEAPTDAEQRCKLGDVWKLGNHRLICGDSTDVTVIDKLMDGQKADIAITSPPYGESDSAKLRDHYVRGNEKRKSLYNQHDDKSDEWASLMYGSFECMQFASESQFVNVQMLADNKRTLVQFIADNADSLVDIIVWDKKKAPPQMQKNVLNNQFEFIFVFSKENNSRSVPFGNFHGNINNIIELSCGKNEFADAHRAVYPVELPAKIMEIASGAISVIDVFGGTGTTMIACEQLNRKCYMCEIDPHYCDVIIQRWENLTGQKAVLINE